MFRNYFIIALRHIRRHRLFSMINLFCLAIGICFALIVGVYILNQREVNSTLREVDQLYVIKSRWKVENMGLPITTMLPFPKVLSEEYPDVVTNYYRFNPVTNVVSAGDRHFKENIAICDTTFISMFGFQLLYGDPDHAFPNNASALITEEMARKLYGRTNVMGETVRITSTAEGYQDYTVSGVLKTLPYCTVNNYIDNDGYSVFVSFEGNHFFQNPADENDWTNIYMPGMVKLAAGADKKALIAAAGKTLALHTPESLKGLLEPEFVPMRAYYLKDNNGAVEKMIRALSLIALFIVLMAIINFININIGTSGYRLKEIGLRKVFGGSVRQLVAQHMLESWVLTAVAGLLSLLVYEIVRPVFDAVLNTRLSPVWAFDAPRFALFATFLFAVGLLAGVYPALILSTRNTIHAVKGKIDTARGGQALRKALLVIQFSLAIFIFIAAVNVSRQVHYIFHKDLGYQRDQRMVITAFPKKWDSTGVLHMENIKKGLETLSDVQAASLSFEVPDRRPPGTIDLVPEGTSKPVVIPMVEVDEDYAATFGLKLIDGHFFDHYERPAVINEIVLNESAARMLGLKDPVGKTIRMPAGFAFTITGVVGDYNYSSFHQAAGPMSFVHVNNATRYRYLTLKLKPGSLTTSIERVRQHWKSLSPDAPFEFTFMDQRFASLYRSELQLKKAAGVATGLNLLIVFLGVFGVVAFTLARRTKEIAVRKVLGAGLSQILRLFYQEYAALILVANLVAWPLAYWASDRWLQSYTYRIEQNMLTYVLVAALVFIMVLLFIMVQCFRSASSNPVKSLRTE